MYHRDVTDPNMIIGANANQYSWNITMRDIMPAFKQRTPRYKRTLLVFRDTRMLILMCDVQRALFYVVQSIRGQMTFNLKSYYIILHHDKVAYIRFEIEREDVGNHF
jgi:hypothetical protein